MKFSESWLREWVNPALSQEALCEKLTMSGFEVEEVTAVAGKFKGVIIGQILKIEKHPEADKLTLCDVGIGGAVILKIVCGASNVSKGIRVPVALVGAELSNNMLIKTTSIRGVTSQGMLCSSAELQLSADGEGLMILPEDAPLGMDLRHYLHLDDHMIDLAITPNRGDCLSIKGVAREIAALTNAKLQAIKIPKIKPKIKDVMPVKVTAEAGCPRYVGRVIRQVNALATSPSWLTEKLRRSGIKSISAVVDIANYVMLELGQPMHAFDLDTIDHEIKVRYSIHGEKIALLDDTEKELDGETLIIADCKKPLAIAGVMGGTASSVTPHTQNIFLESAYFSPKTIAKARQHYQLSSDSAYRFERGIDPTIQEDAILRATQLVLEIAGGEAGPMVAVESNKHLPPFHSISLDHDKIALVLGIHIPDKTVASIFKTLGFEYKRKKNSWMVQVPPHRSDVTLPEDLIEELARLYGYDKIPVHELTGVLNVAEPDKEGKTCGELRHFFRDLGFHEIISYSFIDKKWQSLLDPGRLSQEVLNPITADMEVMRTNLWPGLINTLLFNKSRQQHLVRLFEVGRCFVTHQKKLTQPTRIAGLISGLVTPEQWGIPSRQADFFDLKGNLFNIFNMMGVSDKVDFKPSHHAALHPGQTAEILISGQKVGIIGCLHPSLLQSLDLSSKVFLFELELEALELSNSLAVVEISKFPEIRRDIAILVNETVPAKDIQDTIRNSAGVWLKDVFIFDVYQGKGITPGLKSIALALILQDATRTLIDDEVAQLMERVVTALKGQLGAELRS